MDKYWSRHQDPHLDAGLECIDSDARLQGGSAQAPRYGTQLSIPEGCFQVFMHLCATSCLHGVGIPINFEDL